MFEIVQALIQCYIIVILSVTYYDQDKVYFVKHLLFVSSIEMMLSNFNVYRDSDNNWENLNFEDSDGNLIHVGYENY